MTATVTLTRAVPSSPRELHNHEEQLLVDSNDWPTEEFERHRPHLQAVAYRMLGSVSEAEDAVQESWLRLNRSGPDGIASLPAWLTTVVGRVCIDMLRARQARREDYSGTWLPEPIVSADDPSNPEHEALIADSVGLALLVVLETLTPAERLAFVLHDMFAVPFEEIGVILERSPAAARQLASRARRQVRGAAPESEPDLAKQRKVVAAFLAASRAGDFDALLTVLAPEVVFRADAGKLTNRVVAKIAGATEVARYTAVQGPRFATLCHPALVNGAAGLVLQTMHGPIGAVGFTVTNGLITTIDLILDPGKINAIKTTSQTSPTP
jgi:RNA polymerase sigma factor (sigma-70 family)